MKENSKIGNAMSESEIGRMHMEISAIRSVAEKAEEAANIVSNIVSNHEKICAFRYEGILKQMESIPDIYKEIKALSRWVYIGIGLCIALGAFGQLADIIHRLGGRG